MAITRLPGPQRTECEPSDRRSAPLAGVTGVIFTAMEGRLLPGALTRPKQQGPRMREIDSPTLDREGESGSHRLAPNAHPGLPFPADKPIATANAGSWHRSRTLARAMGAILRWTKWLAALPPQWAERDRSRRFLSGLDDYMLKDLGLSRADVERETSKSFWRE
jgi:uncharacterized protein YjiS (DUF1127 family)